MHEQMTSIEQEQPKFTLGVDRTAVAGFATSSKYRQFWIQGRPT
jgi:hypothetical protein